MLNKPVKSETAVVSDATAREALEAVLASDNFANSEKLRGFLSYIVAETLDGNAAKLKGYTIAIDVLGRDETFDAEKDTVVRVHASRLRSTLDQYYAGQGANDPVRITVPKGGYVPKFMQQQPTVKSGELSADEAIQLSRVPFRFGLPPRAIGLVCLAFLLIAGVGAMIGFWLSGSIEKSRAARTTAAINTLAVIPIEHDATGEKQQRIAQTLMLDLVRSLENGNFISVALAAAQKDFGGESLAALASQMDVRFILTGTLTNDNAAEAATHRLTLSLVDGKTGFTTWSEAYDYAPAEPDLLPYQTLVEAVSYDLKPAYYTAAKHVVEAEGRKNSSAVELFLISNFVPGTAVSSLEWEKERIALARQALAVDPTYGPAHSVLADKLAYLATIDPPSDTEEMLEASSRHADLALTYAGETADAVFNMAIHKMHRGDMVEAARYAERAAMLDPTNALARFFADQAQYICRRAPDSVLADMITFHDNLNPKHPARWITATTISRVYLNNENYPEAVRWGRIAEGQFQSPDSAYQLMAALVQVNRTADARRIFEKQKRLWPNLDAVHFAKVTTERRCNAPGDAPHLLKVFADLAKALN